MQQAMCKLDPEFCQKQYDKLCLEDIDVIDQSDLDQADTTEK
jgi:serine O-acetyltransferase